MHLVSVTVELVLVSGDILGSGFDSDERSQRAEHCRGKGYRGRYKKQGSMRGGAGKLTFISIITAVTFTTANRLSKSCLPRTT